MDILLKITIGISIGSTLSLLIIILSRIYIYWYPRYCLWRKKPKYPINSCLIHIPTQQKYQIIQIDKLYDNYSMGIYYRIKKYKTITDSFTIAEWHLFGDFKEFTFPPKTIKTYGIVGFCKEQYDKI